MVPTIFLSSPVPSAIAHDFFLKAIYRLNSEHKIPILFPSYDQNHPDKYLIIRVRWMILDKFQAFFLLVPRLFQVLALLTAFQSD